MFPGTPRANARRDQPAAHRRDSGGAPLAGKAAL